MGSPTNSDYSRAIQELTIARIWQEAGLPGRVPTSDAIYKSPFRDERTPSFSIFGRMRNWKDHGTGDGGGIVDFAKKCWSELSDEDFREKLIDVSGIVRSPKKAAAAPSSGDAPAGAAPQIVIPKAVEKAAKAIEKRQRLSEAEERLYQEREALLRPMLPKEKMNLPSWPECVRDRFAEGWEQLRADPKAQQRLADARGWPVAWVEELVNLELLSYVLERGFDSPSERYAKRQKAFRVDVPMMSTRVTKEIRPGVKLAAAVDLRPVGYHQRFFIPPQGDKPEQKSWMFVPSFPKYRARSNFERAIVKEGLARGLRYEVAERGGGGGEREPFITAAPFVLGDLQRPRVIVILEGQWDAITFFGSCGWFHDTSPASGVAVFGIRGAQGLVPFLSYWNDWLHVHKPLAWVIADNDAAGGTWRDAPPAKPGELQMPSFAEKLEAAGCRKVYVSWLKGRGQWGKDFNDYYRAKKPAPDAMHRMMQKIGVLDASGGWA